VRLSVQVSDPGFEVVTIVADEEGLQELAEQVDRLLKTGDGDAHFFTPSWGGDGAPMLTEEAQEGGWKRVEQLNIYRDDA
jgi:hypothetical protein